MNHRSIKFTSSSLDSVQQNSLESKKKAKTSLMSKIQVYNLEKNGRYHLRYKQWSEAEAIFSRLVECRDEYWVCLGQALQGQERYQEAQECYEHVLNKIQNEFDPIYDVFKGLSVCYLFCNDNEAAEEYLNKARVLKRNKFDIDLALVQSVLLKNKAKYQQAQEHLQDILEEDAECVEAWVHIAEVRAHLGDTDLAYMSLQKALDLHPENKVALKAKIRLSSIFEQRMGYKNTFTFLI